MSPRNGSVDMRKIIYENKQVIICATLVFIVILIFFSLVHPIIPFDGDDVHYLSHFISYPVPIIRIWNPTRIFPEYLQPLTGYLAAFVIYPLTGDYLFSISLSIAVVLAAFITVLYIALYRLFLSLHENKNVCAILSIFAIALCFALFRAKPINNTHMFLSRTYTTYFFYTIPNLLNSIVICELIRHYIKHKSLSISLSSPKSAVLIVMIYFCIFSMLFSALTLLAFAASALLYRFLSLSQPRMKLLPRLKCYFASIIKDFNIPIIIIIGIVVSMLLELTGGRARWDSGNSYFGSVLSFEFITRMIDSAKSLLSHIRFINVLISVIFIGITVTSIILWLIRKNKDTAESSAATIKICILCGILFSVFNIALSAKAGTTLGRQIDYAYGLYFFVILFISLSTLYILKSNSLARLLFPLLTIFILLIAVDSRWPYVDSFYGNPSGVSSGRTMAKIDLMNSYLNRIIEADENGETVVYLNVPKYTTDNNWPLPAWWGESFSNALYRHRVIASKIEIVLVIDEDMTYP